MKVLIISKEAKFSKTIEKSISNKCEVIIKKELDDSMSILSKRPSLIIFNLECSEISKINDVIFGSYLWIVSKEKVDIDQLFENHNVTGYVHYDNIKNVLNSIKTAVKICELTRKETFGDRLKKLREENYLKQSDLAKIVGLSRSIISSYELSSSEPNIERIKFLAKYFKVTVDYLLGD